MLKKKKAFETLKLMSESPKSPLSGFQKQLATTGKCYNYIIMRGKLVVYSDEIFVYCEQHTHFKNATALQWMLLVTSVCIETLCSRKALCSNYVSERSKVKRVKRI